MRATLLVGMAIWLSGCFGYHMPIAGDGYDGPTNPQPRQDEAMAIVWQQAYGETRVSPPPILWHFDDNCVDANSKNGPAYGTPGAFKSAHETRFCMFGQYEASGWVEPTEYDAPDRLDIEWNGSFSFHQTLAHELCHALMQYTTGDGDEDHKSRCFATEDAPYDGQAHPGALSYEATAALVDAGL